MSCKILQLISKGEFTNPFTNGKMDTLIIKKNDYTALIEYLEQIQEEKEKMKLAECLVVELKKNERFDFSLFPGVVYLCVEFFENCEFLNVSQSSNNLKTLSLYNRGSAINLSESTDNIFTSIESLKYEGKKGADYTKIAFNFPNVSSLIIYDRIETDWFTRNYGVINDTTCLNLSNFHNLKNLKVSTYNKIILSSILDTLDISDSPEKLAKNCCKNLIIRVTCRYKCEESRAIVNNFVLDSDIFTNSAIINSDGNIAIKGSLKDKKVIINGFVNLSHVEDQKNIKNITVNTTNLTYTWSLRKRDLMQYDSSVYKIIGIKRVMSKEYTTIESYESYHFCLVAPKGVKFITEHSYYVEDEKYVGLSKRNRSWYEGPKCIDENFFPVDNELIHNKTVKSLVNFKSVNSVSFSNCVFESECNILDFFSSPRDKISLFGCELDNLCLNYLGCKTIVMSGCFFDSIQLTKDVMPNIKNLDLFNLRVKNPEITYINFNGEINNLSIRSVHFRTNWNIIATHENSSIYLCGEMISVNLHLITKNSAAKVCKSSRKKYIVKSPQKKSVYIHQVHSRSVNIEGDDDAENTTETISNNDNCDVVSVLMEEWLNEYVDFV